MTDKVKISVVAVVFLVFIIGLFAYGRYNSNKKYQEENSTAENYPTDMQPEEIDGEQTYGLKNVNFQGKNIDEGAYTSNGKIYVDIDVLADEFGITAYYNIDEDKVIVSQVGEDLIDYVRYTIIDGEYWFYSDSLSFVNFDSELVSMAELGEKGIAVNINKRNTRSSNWEPAYVTDFVFIYNDVFYNVKGKPLVELTVDEDYCITRPEMDITNVTWRISQNGKVLLERNAQNEYQYTYFGNTPGCTYEVALLGYFDGYEVISNTVTYTVE